MEKYYLCSVQSKVNPNQNETILVPVDEVSEFVSSHLRPDCVLYRDWETSKGIVTGKHLKVS